MFDRQLTPTEVPERRFEHRLMLVMADGDCIDMCALKRLDRVLHFLGLETEQRENHLAFCYVFVYLLCCAEQCCMLIICVDLFSMYLCFSVFCICPIVQARFQTMLHPQTFGGPSVS